jgi:peptidoglycan/xylan/chitin deacetylase (PgdA/CDA1 family)
LVRRVVQEGHTVGTHGFNHVELNKLPLDDAKKEIETALKAATDALPGGGLAPFFRAPMLELSPALEKHIVSRGLMIWSIDVDSLDWTDISEEQLVADTIKALEKSGRGILLMHDIQPVTARALPLLLDELKRRNFRVVHVVPAAAPNAAAKVRKTSANTR